MEENSLIADIENLATLSDKQHHTNILSINQSVVQVLNLRINGF